MRYKSIREEARKLRSRGKTYSEIKKLLGIKISKSTLSYWVKDIKLPSSYKEKIVELNLNHLKKIRSQALIVNRKKRIEYLKSIESINRPIAEKINEKPVSKIALAMLCLGEASKYRSKRRGAFTLGSSDKRIVILFLEFLKQCFNFHIDKIRCTVQCRADQNTARLEEYWQKVTKIPPKLFYKARIDPRTIGKPTKKKEYKGVLRVDYLDTNVQLELESLADLVYNTVFRARSLTG